MREDDKLAPITPYCVAKLAGEQMLDFYARRANLSWLALRFFNVYGPGQPTDAYYTSVVVTFLNRLAAGEAPAIDGRGDQSMDFVHVSDVARSVGMSLDSDATGLVLNVGTGRQTTIADLADMLIELSGADVRPQFRPREVLVTQRQASIDRIAEAIGWSPRVDLEEGLASIIQWLKARQVVV
jgi:UDP-glucose 4-epimerase